MNKRIIAIGLALSLSSLSCITAQAKKISSNTEAEELALDYVKGATVLHVEEDDDDGVWVYEVDMKKGGKKYELKYNASNGKLVEYQWEKISHKRASKKVSEKTIRRMAGKKVKNATITEFDYDSDDAKYEIEMYDKNKKYELEYSADGTLISYKWEKL